MRSSELARLAGVSIRTLRHYHQIGVLAETERSPNGYREYDVHDLVRVLRIRRLASLGIALERMAPLLEDAEVDADPLLEDLDAELAAQIEHLAGQRAAIAQLRRHRALPDLPPELAAFSAVLAEAGITREMARLDRDQALLLTQLAGAEGRVVLTRLYERMIAPEVVGEVVAALTAFADLDDDAADARVADVARRFASAIRPVLTATAEGAPEVDLSAGAELLSLHVDDALNAAQRRALALLAEELERAAP